MGDNVDAPVPVPPAPTPIPSVAPPTPIAQPTPIPTVTPATPMPTPAPPTPMPTLAPPIPTTPRCEIEFRNLMAFRGLPNTKENLCRVALEEWESTAKLLGKKEKEFRSIRNEIYQMVGFYSAFQGLLLTAIAQSNLLHWNNRGYPLALSAFATGIAATGVVQKNKSIRDLKKILATEIPARKALLHRVYKLRLEGIHFSFQDVYAEECKVRYQRTKLEKLYLFLVSYETFWCTLCSFYATDFTSPRYPYPLLTYIIYNLVRMFSLAISICKDHLVDGLYALILQIVFHPC